MFGTVINCMDGRIQLPVISFLMEKYNIDFIDNITEAGPNNILANYSDKKNIESIFAKIKISIEVHGSKLIAITGHHDCAGNPEPKEVQIEQIQKSIQFINGKFPEIKTVGLWINENWKVEEI